FVTAAVTEETARIHADHALRALEAAATRVGRSLTINAALSSGGGSSASDLTAALAEAAAAHPVLVGEVTSRSPGEPFRAFLLYVARRLEATPLEEPADKDLPYGSAPEFLGDLRLLQRALAEAGAARQAYGE